MLFTRAQVVASHSGVLYTISFLCRYTPSHNATRPRDVDSLEELSSGAQMNPAEESCRENGARLGLLTLQSDRATARQESTIVGVLIVDRKKSTRYIQHIQFSF